jgi:serine/threonine protein kinase/Tol biopolymer transport system component
MALTPGTRLGSYEITAAIGAGGMGEVYRARDPKLGRDVAIKVLPASVAGDPDRLARFEREAQAVASLSHPNIVSVFEFGARDGTPFVVMELLEGETLRERLGAPAPAAAGESGAKAGGLPARKAIDIATQIARGLAGAHDKNLIHRDLKPENVFLLADGQVKILDFGLARAIDASAQPSGSGASQTIARTEPGTVMGTVGYMAPEQVRGGAVDARTDLFALGAVLYEMLTGARAFQRETQAETLTAVLREDPTEISRFRADLPPALDRIVQHALEKNPAERFQTARDVIFALTALSGSSSATSVESAPTASSAPATHAGSRTAILAAIPAAVAVLAGVVGWWVGRASGSSGAPAPRFDQFTQLTDESGAETQPRLSPDGASFAVVKRVGNSDDNFVQRTGGRQPLAVAADPNRDEHWPAFSPDGRFIAFNESDADGGVFIIGATGESERRLTDTGFNPAWSTDGRTIAFSAEEVVNPYIRNAETALYVVDVAGGAPRLIQPVLMGKQDCVQPAWSPRDRRIACWQAIGGQRDLVTMAPDGSDRIVLLNDAALDYAPAWSPDGRYLYFASDRGGNMGLWRVGIDESTGRTTGEPESVSVNVEAAMDLPSFSADGKSLLFRSRLESVNPAVVPFDPATERAGTPKLLMTRTGILNPTSVSPDGQWLALCNQGDIKEDLYVMKVDGTGLRRLTDDAARDRQPRWAPDGKSITFYSNREGGRYSVYSIRPDGSGLTRLLPAAGGDFYYGAISPADGSLVLNNGVYESFVVSPPFPAKESQIRRLENSAVEAGTLQLSTWSPDGRLISGGVTSKASASAIGVGVYDVGAKKAVKLNDDPGQWTVPFLDTRRVIYVTPRNELVVVDIVTGQRRVIPVTLGAVNTESFAIAPDGKALYFGAHRVEANVWKVTAR